MSDQVRVLIVDDSALVRTMLTELLSHEPGIVVVGTASDPLVARDKIKQLHPDVLTLDIEMPRMDGISFLRKLMRLRPMPVVMISTLTEKGAPITLEALEIGAVDFLAKPKNDVRDGLLKYRDEIIEKVLTAASANVQPRVDVAPNSIAVKKVEMGNSHKHNIVAIGASTGGTEAIKEVVMSFPMDCPPVLVTQHIPKSFSTSFALRLENCCDVRVYEAVDGQPLENGSVYLAPGDKHLRLAKNAKGYYCKVFSGDLVNRHRPSVEVLFDSITEEFKTGASFALLTGMGSDGSRALLRAHEAGHLTIAQDKATSVVWGMPGVAVELGAAQEVLPLRKIAASLLS